MSANQSAARLPEVILAVSGVFHHFDLARELDARGYLKRIYSTFPWKRLQRENIARDKVRMFPWIHTPQMILGSRLPRKISSELSWLTFRTFDSWIAASLPRCDVFVALSGSGLKSGRRAQEAGARHVCDRGSSHIRYQNKIVREEYERWGIARQIVDPRIIAREEAEYAQADAITVPSEFARRSFIEMGVPASKMRKIPYGVRLERFRPAGRPADDRFDVLFAGSVNLRKGVPYLLEAFAQVRHPRKKLLVIGGIDDSLRTVLPRLPLDGVEFAGHVSQDRLAAAMSTSHVMVLPSIEEGLALVQAQAMACGCPLISSTNTGGEDLFSDGVEGFVVPIRSPEAIRNRLQQIADDPALQQKMSAAAISRVRSIGGWGRYGELWASFVDELSGVGQTA